LGAEALALGAAAASGTFWLRHAYLLLPLLLAAWSFGSTVGLGCSRPEMIRRCALVRAQLRAVGGAHQIAAFAGANLALFGLSQAIEGAPIAAGSLGLGLAAALIGALLSSIIVFTWARTLAVALLVAVGRQRRGALASATRRILSPAISRAASAAFSLFVPNRPPPALSPLR
jgi:hypothetical protein